MSSEEVKIGPAGLSVCVVEGERRKGFWKQGSKALGCQQVPLRGSPGTLGLGPQGVAAGTSCKGLGTPGVLSLR